VRAKQLDRWVSGESTGNHPAFGLWIGQPRGQSQSAKLDGMRSIIRRLLISGSASIQTRMDVGPLPEWGWMDKVTTGGPVLIVAEGLTMYLAQG
jgi:hypothetical protein